jgi:hypothetical protein
MQQLLSGSDQQGWDAWNDTDSKTHYLSSYHIPIGILYNDAIESLSVLYAYVHNVTRCYKFGTDGERGLTEYLTWIVYNQLQHDIDEKQKAYDNRNVSRLLIDNIRAFVSEMQRLGGEYDDTVKSRYIKQINLICTKDDMMMIVNYIKLITSILVSDCGKIDLYYLRYYNSGKSISFINDVIL